MSHRTSPTARTLFVLLALCALIVLASGCATSGAAAAPAAAAAAAAPPPPPPPAIVGAWNLLIETPVGNQEPTFTVSLDDGALTGVFSGEQGDLEIPEITDTDGQIAFSMEIHAGGQQLKLDFTGTVDGDSITGSFASDFGDMPVTGTRVQ